MAKFLSEVVLRWSILEKPPEIFLKGQLAHAVGPFSLPPPPLFICGLNEYQLALRGERTHPRDDECMNWKEPKVPKDLLK